jgi:hypothetical protein
MNPHEVKEAMSIKIRVLILNPCDRPRPLVTVLSLQRRRLDFSRISLSGLTATDVRTSASVRVMTVVTSHPRGDGPTTARDIGLGMVAREAGWPTTTRGGLVQKASSTVA